MNLSYIDAFIYVFTAMSSTLKPKRELRREAPQFSFGVVSNASQQRVAGRSPAKGFIFLFGEGDRHPFANLLAIA